MSGGKKEVFSTVEGLFQQKVTLTEERLEYLKKHFVDVGEKVADIKGTVEEPDRVYKTTHSGQSYQYRRWTTVGKKYMVVGVHLEEYGEEIRTAWEATSDNIDYNKYDDIRMKFSKPDKGGESE